MKRIRELDGIRGLAILLVLLWHCFNEPTPWGLSAWTDGLKSTTQMSWSGVDLFFVLSGFLLGGILLDGRIGLRAFYQRRFFRIVPIYYLALFLLFLHERYADPTLLTNVLLSRGHPPFWEQLLFLQNFHVVSTGSWGPLWTGPTWSLAVEEQFYLFLPLLVLLIPRRALMPALIAWIAAAPVFRWEMHSVLSPVAIFVLLPARMDALLMGVLGAWLARQRAPERWVRTPRFRAAFILLLAGYLGLTAYSPGPFASVTLGIGSTWTAAFYLALIFMALEEPAFKAIFGLRVLGFLGSISYGVYLSHAIVQALWFSFVMKRPPSIEEPADLLVTAGAMALTTGICWLSFRYVEGPLIRWGRAHEGPPKREALSFV
jgi:peptidoglycan/LPS O-acetylase OafA/YrhL